MVKKKFRRRRRVDEREREKCSEEIEKKNCFAFNVLPFVTESPPRDLEREGSEVENSDFFFFLRSQVDAFSIMKMAHKYLIKNTN